MSGVSGFFSDCYKSVADGLTEEALENFKTAKSDSDRITLLYPHCKDIKIGKRTFHKNYDVAQRKKEEGNSHFAKHEDYKALKCYNVGIINCPSTPEDCRKLLAVLIANRSACLYEIGEYETCLNDIAYTLSLKTYPEELKYKLFLRRAKCCSNTADKKHQAVDAYKAALQCLNQSKLNPKLIEDKQLEITKALEKIKTYKAPPEVQKIASQPFVSNATYKNASEAIGFGHDAALGRFAFATKDIETGVTIIDEPAYCAVLAEDSVLTNCQNCMLAIDTPVACSHCVDVVFCTLKCKADATVYHKHECGLHETLVSSGASINCRMALRIVTQRDLHYFEEIMKNGDNESSLADYLSNQSHDYQGVYALCRMQEKRTVEEFVQYTIMAIYLLKLLKMSTFFDKQQDGTLTNKEVFIGSLILRHLQALQFNAHEISELREAPPGPLDPKDEPNFKTIYIGGGVYTTLALFNHSCDPSIVRYNVGSKMIVKTIKPIRKGEMVYENYGPIYTNSSRRERQKFLSNRYWFTCTCDACENDWPEFKSMEETELKIRCTNKKCSSFFYLHNSLDSPAIKCSKCSKVTNLFPQLKALSSLEELLPRAEELYKNKEYREAAKLYFVAIKIYHNHTVPPFPDWVKVQQRLRTCIVSEGNKSIEYIKIRGIKGRQS